MSTLYRKPVDDETEANAVWQEILTRKGLPLDTSHKFESRFDKTYDESYCDRLFSTIEERKRDPEAAKKWPGKSIYEWLPAPNYDLQKEGSSSSSSSSSIDGMKFLLDKKPAMKNYRSVNRIVYADPESKARKRKMVLDARAKFVATFPPGATSLFTF